MLTQLGCSNLSEEWADTSRGCKDVNFIWRLTIKMEYSQTNEDNHSDIQKEEFSPKVHENIVQSLTDNEEQK